VEPGTYRPQDQDNHLEEVLREVIISHAMLIGERLRELRESKKLSQGDVEKRTGLLRCYTSRVENGHTVPSIETLEKYARALEVPMYKLFIEGEKVPKKPNLPQTESAEAMWGKNEKERRELRRFAKVLSRMGDEQRKLLLAMATRMARPTGRRLGG
jgi:transcriptional regulator with XRE-family HTH domain